MQIPGYQVVKHLGSGAGSSIWSIRKQDTGELFALKRVVRRHPSDHRFLEQAEKEYEISSRLDHPNLRRCVKMSKIRKFFKVNELQLIMEFCEGKSVQENRPTDIAETVTIFTAVAEALNYMHRSGVLHADMKPNNIIVSPQGLVKVIDFGQGCELGTVKERIQGTPDFIAPEQVNRLPLDARTDVFNFGASLYWTLTGQAIKTVIPRQADSIQLRGALNLAPVTDINPDVPQALSTLVSDCISFKPTQRPNSMQPVLVKLALISRQLDRQDMPVAENTGPDATAEAG